MNRLTKLFQQKSNKKFDEYLLAKRKSLSEAVPPLSQAKAPYPTLQDLAVSVLKAESETWAKAAELLRKEELNQK